MFRIGRPIVAAFCVLFCSSLALTADEPSLHLEVACDGAGIAGTLSRGTVVVHFVGCATPDGGHARIFTDEGVTLTEVYVHDAAGYADLSIGGIDLLPGRNTADELQRMGEVLAMPEARLAGTWLWQRLRQSGRLPRAGGMAAIAANLTLYEGTGAIVQASPDCLGCCGPGCWGCTGCYTNECFLHDVCVRSLGVGHPSCMSLMPLAALSAWRCRD